MVITRKPTGVRIPSPPPQQKNANPRSGAHFFVAAEAEHGMRTAPQTQTFLKCFFSAACKVAKMRAARFGGLRSKTLSPFLTVCKRRTASKNIHRDVDASLWRTSLRHPRPRCTIPPLYPHFTLQRFCTAEKCEPT